MTTPIKPGESVHVVVTKPDGSVYDETFTAEAAPPVPAPADWTQKAVEGGSFTAPAGSTVRYGIEGKYAIKVVGGTIACNNATFGDPAVGAQKHCDLWTGAGTPPVPTPGPTPPTPIPPSGGAFLSYPKTTTPTTISNRTGLIEVHHQSFVGIRGAVALAFNGCKGDFYLHDLDYDKNLGCIYFVNCSGTLRIEDIRARDTGDDTIGAGHSNVIQLNASRFANSDPLHGIRRVKSLGGHSEDMISVYESGGTDPAHRLVIEDYQCESPLPPDPLAYTSGSGTGLMVEFGKNLVVQRISVLNAGQGGLAFNGGDDVHFLDNVVYLAQRPKSNVGVYGLKPADSPTGWEVSRNRSWARHDDPPYDNPAWKPDNVKAIGWDGTNTNKWQDPTIDPATMHVVL